MVAPRLTFSVAPVKPMFAPPGTPAIDIRDGFSGRPIASLAFDILEGPKEARDDGRLFI